MAEVKVCYRCKVRPRQQTKRGLDSYCKEHRDEIMQRMQKVDRQASKTRKTLSEFYRP